MCVHVRTHDRARARVCVYPNTHLKYMLRSRWNVLDKVHELVEVLKGTITLVIRVHSSGHVAQDGHIEGAGSGHPGKVVYMSE